MRQHLWSSLRPRLRAHPGAGPGWAAWLACRWPSGARRLPQPVGAAGTRGRRGHRLRVVGVQEDEPLVRPEPEAGREPGADHVPGDVDREQAGQPEHVAGEAQRAQRDEQPDRVQHHEQAVLSAQPRARPVGERPVPVAEVGAGRRHDRRQRLGRQRPEAHTAVQHVEQADIDDVAERSHDPELGQLVHQELPAGVELPDEAHVRRSWRSAVTGRAYPCHATINATTPRVACHVKEVTVLDFRLTEEQETLRKTVEQFARTVVAPKAHEYDESGAFPYDVVRQMAGMGLFGLPFPEEYGGMGGDYFALCLAIEELARADSSVAITLEAGVSLGAMPVYRFGSPEQKREWLPRLTSGQALGAFGLTEPDGGSD